MVSALNEIFRLKNHTSGPNPVLDRPELEKARKLIGLAGGDFEPRCVMELEVDLYYMVVYLIFSAKLGKWKVLFI